MAEYVLNQVASEVQQAINKALSSVQTVNGVSPDENGNVEVETSSQSDWNAAEGEPGHVLNRTHYEERVKRTIEFDGDVTGKTAVAYGIGYLVKVSDETPTMEELTANDTTVTLTVQGQTHSGPVAESGATVEQLSENAYSFMWDGMHMITVCRETTTVMSYGQTVTLEPGTHFCWSDGMIGINSISYMETAIHHIDPKYIKDMYYEETTVAEILPEATVTLDAGEGVGIITPTPTLVLGETYQVVYDGTEYSCKAEEVKFNGQLVLAMGNHAMLTGGDTGEPFIVAVLNGQCVVISTTAAASCTISISGGTSIIHPLDPKFLGTNWNATKTVEKTVIVPETTLSFANAKTVTLASPPSFSSYVNGATAKVVWDGVEYECVVLADGEYALIGNGSLWMDGGTDTGEPFFYVHTTVGAFVYIAEAATVEHTLQITQVSTTYSKLPEEHLDADVLRAKLAPTVFDLTSIVRNTEVDAGISLYSEVDDIVVALAQGKQVTLMFKLNINDNTYTFTVTMGGYLCTSADGTEWYKCNTLIIAPGTGSKVYFVEFQFCVSNNNVRFVCKQLAFNADIPTTETTT